VTPHVSKCAEPAGVSAYDDGCAIYALAVDQSVQDLTDCLYKAGVSAHFERSPLYLSVLGTAHDASLTGISYWAAVPQPPNTDKYKGLLSKCAEPAGVSAYDDGCAIYALAVDQSVQDMMHL
jgi:uncharacterized protein (DUF885 family)